MMRMVQSFYAYSTNPIDHYWEHLESFGEALKKICKYSDYTAGANMQTDEIRSFLNLWDSAKEIASKIGWEGDIREPRDGPKVFWIPGDDCHFLPGFVFKQDNNGTTFVISPVPMPHLES